MLPRHLEIIEINRRLLEVVRNRFPGTRDVWQVSVL
jgi:hypothetical protein